MKQRLLGAILVLVLGAATASAEDAVADGRRSYTGTIEGAAFRVEVPARWNGTLLLYSHGYHPEGFHRSASS